MRANHLQSLPEALAVSYSFVYFHCTEPSRTIKHHSFCHSEYCVFSMFPTILGLSSSNQGFGITDYPCRSCSQPTRFTAFPKFRPGEDNFMPVYIPPVNKELIEEHEKSPENIGFDSFSFSSQKGSFYNGNVVVRRQERYKGRRQRSIILYMLSRSFRCPVISGTM
jgi:hypothetical protein